MGGKVKIILIMVFIVGLTGCMKEKNFILHTEIANKEIVNINELYYVKSNGEPSIILITKDEVPCRIKAIKKNDKGVIALGLYVFTVSNIGNRSTAKFFDMVSSPSIMSHYVVFISPNMKIKYKQLPKWIEDIEWVNNDKLKVLMDGDQIVTLKNPF